MRVRRFAVWMLLGVSLTAQQPLGSAEKIDFYGREKEAALGDGEIRSIRSPMRIIQFGLKLFF